MAKPDGDSILRTCYFCGAPETSREHVPPKWMFPKPGDSPPGKSYRPEQMATVPSCDIHNTRKARDDAYLMHVVCMSQGVNEAGILQIPKIMRAYRERPALLLGITRTEHPATNVDHAEGAISDVIAMSVDVDRVTHVLSLLAHATYFYHFGERPRYAGRVLPEFVHSERLFYRKQMRQVSRVADATFIGTQLHGSVPEVWSYQVSQVEDSVTMRFHIYGGVRFLALFAPTMDDSGP